MYSLLLLALETSFELTPTTPSTFMAIHEESCLDGDGRRLEIGTIRFLSLKSGALPKCMTISFHSVTSDMGGLPRPPFALRYMIDGDYRCREYNFVILLPCKGFWLGTSSIAAEMIVDDGQVESSVGLGGNVVEWP